MRYSASTPICFAVKTFDKEHLLGSEARSVVPSVVLVVFDAVGLAVAGWVDETTSDKVGFFH